MKKLLLLLTPLLLGISKLEANNGGVTLHFKGAIIQAEQLEKGAVDYYHSIGYETKVIPMGSGHFFEREKVRIERYFLRTGDALEEITPYNYKEMIKKYLPNAPELHKRLGKFGFRFENVRYMIQYYNRFKS
jgi:hypothetical protein